MSDVRSIVEQQARAGTRWRVVEALPWLLFVGFYFLFETRLALGNSVLVMVLFTLSLDLVLGYAGIATLGHAEEGARQPDAPNGAGRYPTRLLTSTPLIRRSGAR